MKAQWKDFTVYRQGERGRIAPRTWMLQLEDYQIIVTLTVDYGETWTVLAKDLLSKRESLHTEDVDEAKQEALTRCLHAAAAKIIGLCEFVRSLEEMT